jgi:hypothetical protein
LTRSSLIDKFPPDLSGDHFVTRVLSGWRITVKMHRGKSTAIVVVIAAILGLMACSTNATVVSSTASFLGPDSVITFETGTTALPSVPGVTLTPYGNADSTFSTVLFGSQVYGNASTAGGYTDLYAIFSPPITEVGAWGRRFSVGSGPTQLQVNVYGTSNNLLEGGSLSMLSPSPSFVGFVDPQGISKIEWLGGNTGFFAVDNITFGGQPVQTPEPAMTASLISILSLALSSRRNRSRLSR